MSDRGRPVPDILTENQRRFNMSRIRGRDTKPEMTIRRGLHARGLRFRLHRADLPGRPDLVFPKYSSVIFVHGCFWHGHGCRMFVWPKTRNAFWKKKIGRTRERDQQVHRRLKDMGWRVLAVWECALKGPERLSLEEILNRCEDFIVHSVHEDMALSGTPPFRLRG